jgi:hypothetical protein
MDMPMEAAGAAAPDLDADETPDPARDEELVGAWMNRIKASESVVEQLSIGWKANVRAYMGKVLGVAPRDHVVNVPLEYSYVEQKKSQLVFQVPELHLKPKNPQSAPAVPTFQAAVNHELGPDNADAPTLIDEMATDVLLCGIAGSKIGYSAEIRTRKVPVMEPAPPDPMTRLPPSDRQTGAPQQVQAQRPVMSPDGMLQFGPDGQPVTEPAFQDEQYLAHEEFFWNEFPTEDLLIPVDFVGSNFDRAAWLGMKFVMDFNQAKKELKLPDDFAATIQTPRETLSSEERPTRDGGALKQVEGYEIWYKAAVFAPDENPLPKQIKQLVLIKGHNTPVKHENSPYQWLGDGEEGRPNDGKLHGMEGFPIHPLTLRFLPGSAYPVSDVGIARPLSEEISLGRTQMVQFRDRSIPMQWFDRTQLTPEIVAKLDRGEIMARIGIDGSATDKIGIIALPQFPRDNYTFNEIGEKDLRDTWAIRPATVETEGRTATEVRDATAVSDVRLDKERTKFLRWFTTGGAKFASLLQQFKDDAGYVEIVGADGQKALQAWDRKAVQGEFVYTAKPDSAQRLDADVERRQAANLYNLIGRDPNVRRTELLKPLITKHNMDPEKIVVETPPEEPKPEMKFNFSFKAEDLSNPQVLGILKQGGIEIMPPIDPMTGQPVPPPAQEPPPQPGAAQPVQQPHPGAVPTAEAINRHQMRGGGAPTVN